MQQAYLGPLCVRVEDAKVNEGLLMECGMNVDVEAILRASGWTIQEERQVLEFCRFIDLKRRRARVINTRCWVRNLEAIPMCLCSVAECQAEACAIWWQGRHIYDVRSCIM